MPEDGKSGQAADAEFHFEGPEKKLVRARARARARA